ncbi:MAG: hypothetical protein K8R58_06760 [Bacteroidales bacterium]|nr:hypothetical protein [Bacteroidales bacterium]
MTDSILEKYLIWGIGFFIVILSFVIWGFFKPGKKLYINGNIKIKDSEGGKVPQIDVIVRNTGKNKINLVTPYIKFKTKLHSKIFQINSNTNNKIFPLLLLPDKEYCFNVNLFNFKKKLGKELLNCKSVRIILKDNIGFKFQSDKIELDKSLFEL